MTERMGDDAVLGVEDDEACAMCMLSSTAMWRSTYDKRRSIKRATKAVAGMARWRDNLLAKGAGQPFVTRTQGPRTSGGDGASTSSGNLAALVVTEQDKLELSKVQLQAELEEHLLKSRKAADKAAKKAADERQMRTGDARWEHDAALRRANKCLEKVRAKAADYEQKQQQEQAWKQRHQQQQQQKPPQQQRQQLLLQAPTPPATRAQALAAAGGAAAGGAAAAASTALLAGKTWHERTEIYKQLMQQHVAAAVAAASQAPVISIGKKRPREIEQPQAVGSRSDHEEGLSRWDDALWPAFGIEILEDEDGDV